MKQNKKRVFVRLGQVLENARLQTEKKEVQQKSASEMSISKQNASNMSPSALNNMPLGQPLADKMSMEQQTVAKEAVNPAQKEQPQQNMQGAPYMPYMQIPMYMPPYMQVVQPQHGQQQPFVQTMPNMANVPVMVCVPDAQGRPQWVQAMPSMPFVQQPMPQAQQFVQPAPFVQPQGAPMSPDLSQVSQQQTDLQQSSVVTQALPVDPIKAQEETKEPQAAKVEPVIAQETAETKQPQALSAVPIKAQEETKEPQVAKVEPVTAQETAETKQPQALSADPIKAQEETKEPQAAKVESVTAQETVKTKSLLDVVKTKEASLAVAKTENEEGIASSQKPEVIADPAFTRKKNRIKAGRVIFELLVLAAIGFILVELFFTFKTYEPFASAAVSEEDRGFIALSYFGVDRNGETSTLIGKEHLRRQLSELRDQGYVTISQQDILDYYRDGKPLPPRSLFLMFEDGRRDTAIFAQEIMEDLNFKATIMTYPEKFVKEDTNFLSPKDLRDLEKTTFWELGTNGYRLSYINVFDRYGDFLGQLDPLRFNMVRTYLDRRYNHYLMDYIRDKEGVPIESERQMERRVTYDYKRLRDIYQEELGYVPQAHVLMHANTGSFGNNPYVSLVNERWIREIFPMNFNREGFVLNRRDSSLYDLTRMQPQPYWSINHLIMRINYDTDGGLSFVDGREEGRRAWELKEGALECYEEALILTTLPEGNALARLAGIEDLQDLRLETELEGNAFGSQQIFLRSSVDLKDAVGVFLVNDQLVIEELKGGEKRELYREKLPVILKEKILSVDEVHQAAKVGENEAFARYAPSPAAANEYLGRANKEREKHVATVEDGAEPYEGRESFQRRSKCKLIIHLRGDRLSVEVDGHLVPEDIILTRTESGSVFLGSSWQGEAWSQRNLADDVYDGVFKKVRILSETGKASDDETVLYSSEYKGMEKMQHRAKEIWERVLRWFLN